MQCFAVLCRIELSAKTIKKCCRSASRSVGWLVKMMPWLSTVHHQHRSKFDAKPKENQLNEINIPCCHLIFVRCICVCVCVLFCGMFLCSFPFKNAFGCFILAENRPSYIGLVSFCIRSDLLTYKHDKAIEMLYVCKATNFHSRWKAAQIPVVFR